MCIRDLLPRNLDGAELAQMRGDELRVEKPEAARDEPRDEMNKGDLARIRFAAEHAFAKKCRAQRDPVEPADEA